ncbi:MAG: hypothetical protein JST16_07670 [Bdellovibrionales bacterium]|nr:hypothetical protein [Bdellovibrionales bacterium]
MQTTAVPFRTELFFLAEDEMKSNRKFTSFDNPFKPHDLSMALVQLASKVGRRIIRDGDEALKVFVEEDVAAMLLALPNLFWFWKVLQHSIGCFKQEETRLVSMHEVHTAVRLMRMDFERMYDLRDAQSSAVMAVRVARGVMLASMSGKATVRPNPLFTEAEYVSWVPPQSQDSEVPPGTNLGNTSVFSESM